MLAQQSSRVDAGIVQARGRVMGFANED